MGLQVTSVVWSVVFLMAVGQVHAGETAAETSVEFNQKDLGAIVQLVHPEKLTIELDQKTFSVEPPPALRFFGLGTVNERLDLSWFGDLIGLRFDHLRTGTPVLAFESGALTLKMPIMDNDGGLRCLLGRVGFEGVVLTARLVWDGSNAAQPLQLGGIEFSGKLRGRGVFKSEFLLRKTRDFAVRQMEKSIRELLGKPNVADALESGLLQYSKFYTGLEYQEFLKDSLTFYSEGESSGVRYQVR